MKKLTLLFISLSLLLISINCMAENISIGGSLHMPDVHAEPISPNTSSKVNSYSNPRSADDHSGMRPSPEWLGIIDAEHIADICALLNDPAFIELSELSEEYLEMWSPADAYAPEPMLVIYAPKNVPLWFNLFLRSYDAPPANKDPYQLINMITSTIITSMDTEDLIRTTHLVLDSSYPIDAPFVPTIAVYTSADGSESDVIMATHMYSDGIMHISSRFIPYDVFNKITADDGYMHEFFSSYDVSIFTADDEFPDFDASIQLIDDAAVPKADDEWLSATALELAREMLETKCSPKYAEMHTANQDIIDISTEIGSIDIENASVISIEPFDADQLFTDELFAALETEPSELVIKHMTPKLGSSMASLNASSHGHTYVAAASICTVSDSYFANADFTCCNVTISCGKYNIVASFANKGNNIIDANITPVLAE